LEELGEKITNPILLPIDFPQRLVNGWSGKVIGKDYFGNLTTNILDFHLKNLNDIVIHIGNRQIKGMVQTFGDREPGELIALIGTDQDLSISIVNGDASKELALETGAPVAVTGTWVVKNTAGKD